MKVIVWVAEGTWPACVDAARGWVPTGADVVLLHVTGDDIAATLRWDESGEWSGDGVEERLPCCAMESD
jgi:hypothetical protein